MVDVAGGAVGVVAGVAGAETADPFCWAAGSRPLRAASSIADSASFSCVSRLRFVNASINLKTVVSVAKPALN